MAITVQSASTVCQASGSMSSSTGASWNFTDRWEADLKDSGGTFLFDRRLAVNDYSLTVAAGDLDIDVYDLGTLDVGAGAGIDNLGHTHANARIVAFGIRHQEDGNGGTLRLNQNGTAASWTAGGALPDTMDYSFKEGASAFWYLGETGETVTDTTDHILRFDAVTATCVFDLIFYSKQT